MFLIYILHNFPTILALKSEINFSKTDLVK